MYFAPARSVAGDTRRARLRWHRRRPRSTERGALSVDDVDGAYLFEGALQPDVRLAGHALLVGQALRDGFAGLRVCSEIVPLLGTAAVCDQWCGYEVRADLLISGCRASWCARATATGAPGDR